MRRHVGVKTEGCNTYENQEHTPQKLGCKLHSVLQVLQRYRRAYSERHPVKIEKKSPPPPAAPDWAARPPCPERRPLLLSLSAIEGKSMRLAGNRACAVRRAAFSPA